MYTLDTNAIIYFAQREEYSLVQLESVFSSNENLYIPTICITELFSASNITHTERNAINRILSTLYTIHLDEALARNAGDFRAQYKLKLIDSIIAATALFMGSTLVTRNTKDFKKIPGLQLLKI